MKTLIIVITLLLSGSIFSQECRIEGKKDWEKVEVRTYKQVQEPKDYNYIGEAILDKTKATSLETLAPKLIRKIKENAAKDKACIVYVDFDNLMEVDHGLYYVWTDQGMP